MKYLVIILTLLLTVFQGQSQDQKKLFKPGYIKKTMKNAAEWQLKKPKHNLYDWTNGAFYAGVSGGLWAYYIRYIQADQFTLWLSVWYVGMLIVGGLGSILGAIIGTVVIRILQEFITYIGPQLAEIFPSVGGQVVFASMNMLLGGIIILFMIFEPRGLVHRWNIIKESYRIWPFSH